LTDKGITRGHCLGWVVYALGVLPVYFCFSPATDESLFCQMAISATSDTMVERQAELIIKAA